MREKITHKMPLPYQRTVGGLKSLVQRLEEYNIPDEASVDWRGYTIAEFLWSAIDDDVPRPDPAG
jgi:hypothetical protein